MESKRNTKSALRVCRSDLLLLLMDACFLRTPGREMSRAVHQTARSKHSQPKIEAFDDALSNLS